MDIELIIFVSMVATAVFLLANSVIVPTIGADAQIARRLQARISGVVDSFDAEEVSLLRQSYLRKLGPLERSMEGLPGMDGLARLIQQAGWNIPAYRLVLIGIGLALAAAILMFTFTRQPLFALLAATTVFTLPFLKLRQDRGQRLAKFEEQLPEALDIMSRAMRAGHPFIETLNLVGSEMNNPIAQEFRTTFSDLNYGMSEKLAFTGFLSRVPSVSLMAVVTAVLVQRDTGGNMAEILDKIAAVVRGRFRFQRRIRTLSAEGRMSAWILALVPFVLTGILMVSSPDYLPMLAKDPLGHQIIAASFFMIVVGIFWMRRIIRIDV